MPDLLIRDIPEDIVVRLKQKAELHRRSLQQELRLIVTQAARSEVDELVDRIRERRAEYQASGKILEDSVELLRRDRER